MLEVDHSLRITAKDALDHPYLSLLKDSIDTTTKESSSQKRIKSKK